MKTYSVKVLLKLLILLYPTLPISIFSIISNGIAKSTTERLLCRLRPPAQNPLSSVATLLQLSSSHYVLLLTERALLRRLRSQWTSWFRDLPHSHSLLQPYRLAYFRTSVPDIPPPGISYCGQTTRISTSATQSNVSAPSQAPEPAEIVILRQNYLTIKEVFHERK